FGQAYHTWGPFAAWNSAIAGAGFLYYLLLCRNQGQAGSIRQRPWVLGLKAIFAAFVILTALQAVREAPDLSTILGRLMTIGLGFVWLVAIPEQDDSGSAPQQFGRLLLAALAVLQSLVAYPVAGTQRASATFLLIGAAVVCLADVVKGLSGLLSVQHRN